MKKTKIEMERTGKKSHNMGAMTMIFLLIAGLVAGYFIGKASVSGNCIPQEDLDFFVVQANQAQDDYAKCVQDAWNLQLTCKMQVDAWRQTAISLGYTDNSTN